MERTEPRLYEIEDEAARLEAWMEWKGLSIDDLAGRLGLTYHAVYMPLRVRKHFAPSFKWRVFEAFGPDVARALFPRDDTPDKAATNGAQNR